VANRARAWVVLLSVDYRISFEVGYPGGCGTAFELSPPPKKGVPWKRTIIHGFGNGYDGSYPWSSLIVGAGGVLYGTTLGGGIFSCSIDENSDGCGQQVACQHHLYFHRSRRWSLFPRLTYHRQGWKPLRNNRRGRRPRQLHRSGIRLRKWLRHGL
jgi:hypothetical protein